MEKTSGVGQSDYKKCCKGWSLFPVCRFEAFFNYYLATLLSYVSLKYNKKQRAIKRSNCNSGYNEELFNV